MKVKLISFSQPTADFKEEGLDNVQDLVAFCARVSNPSNQMNTETSQKLIKYLIKHQHFRLLKWSRLVSRSKLPGTLLARY